MKNCKFDNVEDELLLSIQNTNKRIVFLNHYPSINEQKDGYYNRIIFIDNVFSSYLKLYVNESTKIQKCSFVKIKENTFQINLPAFINKVMLTSLINNSFFVVYVHSIFQLFSSFKRMVFFNAGLSVWDVHGVVPEEELSNGVNFIEFYRLQRIEKFAYNHAKIIISVTRSLLSHLEMKYKNGVKVFFVLPIISAFETTILQKIKYTSSKPTVIYSGGVQSWQQVDKMLHFVYKFNNHFKFIFLVSNPEYVISKYKNFYPNEIFPGIIKSVSPDEVNKYYMQSHFGLLFRKDSIINQVACPTKLVEYMQYEIIPIVQSSNIGDFTSLEYNILDYRNPISLSETEYLDMISKNKSVILKLKQIMKSSSEELLAYISSFQTSNNINMSGDIKLILEEIHMQNLLLSKMSESIFGRMALVLRVLIFKLCNPRIMYLIRMNLFNRVAR